MIAAPTAKYQLTNARPITRARRSTVTTTFPKEKPPPDENGSRIASISQFRPSGEVAFTAIKATLSRQVQPAVPEREPRSGRLCLYGDPVAAGSGGHRPASSQRLWSLRTPDEGRPTFSPPHPTWDRSGSPRRSRANPFRPTRRRTRSPPPELAEP